MIRLLIWLIFGVSFKHRCSDEIISTHTFASPWQQIQAGSGPYSVTNIGPWWFASQVVTVVRCEKCGRVRHIQSVTDDLEGISTRFTDNAKAIAKEKEDSPEDSPADSGK